MIDYKQLIIDHTNLLYQEGAKPSLDEFRDMFSRGQLESKEALISVLDRNTPYGSRILIVGGWYGVLASMIKDRYQVSVLELDTNCFEHNKRILGVTSLYGDMFDTDYKTFDCVINTACEHIDYVKWLALLPVNMRVLIQNTDYTVPEDHKFTVASLDEFQQKLFLAIRNTYSVEVVVEGLYSRFTIEGLTYRDRFTT